jgi:CheY-like chemotaxis protein
MPWLVQRSAFRKHFAFFKVILPDFLRVRDHNSNGVQYSRRGRGTMAYILVVDDDHSSRTLMRINLEKRGFQVAEASNGQAAFDRMRDEKPSLLILDIKLPNISGWDVLDYMHRDKNLADIPTIIVTASMAEEVADRLAGHENVIARLHKPVGVFNLVETVRGVMS